MISISIISAGLLVALMCKKNEPEVSLICVFICAILAAVVAEIEIPHIVYFLMNKGG